MTSPKDVTKEKKTAPPLGQVFSPMDVRLGLTRAEDVHFPLRWGIMGTGEIARQFVSAARECPGATMSGVSSRSADNAQAFAEAHAVKKRTAVTRRWLPRRKSILFMLERRGKSTKSIV